MTLDEGVPETDKSNYTGIESDGWGPASSGSRCGRFGSDSLSSGGEGSYGGHDDDDSGHTWDGSPKMFQEYGTRDDKTPRVPPLSTGDAHRPRSKRAGQPHLRATPE